MSGALCVCARVCVSCRCEPSLEKKKKKRLLQSNTRDCGMTDRMFTAYVNHLRKKKKKTLLRASPALRQMANSVVQNGSQV